ncbi:GLPGLI family protein [Ornithobacterium rhinotracheale]|uniref:GLPGLI family protein n=1 Tax=Ornithobacterium rhinotracheale TaxID=28251 RepID=UPI0040371EB0
MKQIILISILFISAQSIAQTLSVDYIYSSAFEDNGNVKSYHLKANDKEALYSSAPLDFSKIDRSKLTKVSNDIYMLEEEPGHYIIYNKNPSVYYKNYLTDSLIYNYTLFNKEKYIYDKLDRMQWKIEEGEIIDCMGFKCQKATTENRGRKWEVLFTNDLNFNAAPWKFYGLPGVILSAKTDDGFFNFKAVKINVLPENIEINNPFKKKQIISFDDYVNKYKELMDTIVSSLKTEDSSTSSTASINTSGAIEKVLDYEAKN